jgi:hypothetical protein
MQLYESVRLFVQEISFKMLAPVAPLHDPPF